MTDVYGYDQPQDANRYTPQQHVQSVPQTHVISMTTMEAPVRWSWCHVVTSIFGFFCCQPFGLISLVMTMMAYSDHKVKDYARSRNKKNMGLGFGIAAIVIGSLIFLIVIILTSIAAQAAVSAINTSSSSFNNYGKGY